MLKRNVAGSFAHEFFHLLHVKRMKPEILGKLSIGPAERFADLGSVVGAAENEYRSLGPQKWQAKYPSAKSFVMSYIRKYYSREEQIPEQNKMKKLAMLWNDMKSSK